MEQEQRALAQVFARLASIPSLTDLREGERLLLNDDTREVFWQWAYPRIKKYFTREEMNTLRENKKQIFHLLDEMNILSSLLEQLHEYARSVVWGLLDGQEVTEPPITLPQRGLSLTAKGTLEEEFTRHQIADGLAGELVALLRHKPFPFRRCPVCQKIFVPVKKQKYCSPNCTYKGVETARKGEKREYMRKYMEKRRKKAKAQQGRKEK